MCFVNPIYNAGKEEEEQPFGFEQLDEEEEQNDLFPIEPFVPNNKAEGK